MIDSLEVKEFDHLEEALIDADVSFGEMTHQCAF